MWIVVLMGFYKSYFSPLVAGTVERSATLHIHAAIYTIWLMLYTVQSSLPLINRMRWHRTLGSIAAVYAIIVFLSGISVTVDGFIEHVQAEEVMVVTHLEFWLPLSDMLLFSIIFGLALYYRKTTELHKRLMVLVGTVMLFPAISRISYSYADGTMNWWFLYGVFLSPVLLGMAHDYCTQKRIYKVYTWGVLFLCFVPMRVILLGSGTGMSITNSLAQYVRG